METHIEAVAMYLVMAVNGATEDRIVDTVQDMAVDLVLAILLQMLFFLLLEQAYPLPLK